MIDNLKLSVVAKSLLTDTFRKEVPFFNMVIARAAASATQTLLDAGLIDFKTHEFQEGYALTYRGKKIAEELLASEQ